MGKRDALIEKYAEELREKCGVEPDMALLRKVTIGCGPAIYDADGELIAEGQPHEIDTIKKNFLIHKLALSDTPRLEAAIDAAIETYGKAEPHKYRAVLYYLLVRHFHREDAYR